MINAGRQNPRPQMGWTRYGNGTTTHRGYIDTSSKSHKELKRSAKIVSISIYLFFAAILIASILVIIR